MRNKIFVIGLIIIGYIAIITGIFVWLGENTPYSIRDQLIQITFYFLEFNFLLIIIGLILNLDTFNKIWQKTSKQTRILLALIVLLGLVLTIFVAPRTHRLYYDEDIYMSIGQNLAHLKKAQMCNEGYYEHGVFQAYQGEYNKQPYGHPYLLSLIYRLFGESVSLSFLFNNLLFGLLIVVVFLIGFLLFDNPNPGLWAAFLFAMVPQNLLWFSTVAVEPSASFFTAFAVLTMLLFIKYQKTSLLFLAVVVLAFSLQFRPESILILAVLFMMILLFNPKLFIEYRFWILGLLFFCLMISLIGHQYAVKNESWGSHGPKLSLDYFKNNFHVNGGFYWQNIRFPAFFTILAVIGLLWFAKWKEKLIIISWFLLFWGIFLFFYAGSYSYGADVRYSLLSYVPLILLAGIGLFQLQQFFNKWINAKTFNMVVISMLMISFISFLPLVRATTQEGWQCRYDHKYAEEFAIILPENSVILTHNPNMFHIWKKNALQASLATTEYNYVANVLMNRFKGGVYFHYNYWCTIPNRVQNSFCEQIIERYDYKIIKEYQIQNYRFALCQLFKKKEPSSSQSTED